MLLSDSVSGSHCNTVQNIVIQSSLPIPPIMGLTKKQRYPETDNEGGGGPGARAK